MSILISSVIARMIPETILRALIDVDKNPMMPKEMIPDPASETSNKIIMHWFLDNR